MPGDLLVSDRGYTLIPVPAATGEFAFPVTIDGSLEPGQTNRLTLTVSRDGALVTDLRQGEPGHGHNGQEQ
jgi:hypothetical protein